jgi:hypothetical protein
VIAAGLTALTAASEKVSFTKLIAATPPLRLLDEWGRIRPAQNLVPVSSSGLSQEQITDG